MPVGDISPVGLVKAPKSVVDALHHWVSTRHANFMASTHDQTGDKALHFYTTSRAPVLNEQKDLDSGAAEDGSEWIVWTEYYAKMDGLLDHWEQGKASGMLGDFFALTAEADATFVQPLKVLHEVNRLIPTKDKPRAALADLSGACQLLAMFTVPKEHIAEAEKMVHDHAAWMKELHGEKHTMLGKDRIFKPEEELLYYSLGTCPVLNNHMDLASGSNPDGSVIFLFTEYYKTKAGVLKQWEHAREMNEAKGADFTLAQMTALEEKGMKTTFLQPLEVKASINWFGKDA